MNDNLINQSKKSKFSTLLNKIKNVKNIEIIITIITVCLILLIYLSQDVFHSETTAQSVQNVESTKYIDELEKKLCNVLSQINGAGNVKVLITIDSNSKQEYATNKETKTITSGNSTTTTVTEEVVIVQNKPLLINETLPKIKGVIVVAQGASNVNIKLELLKATQTLLEVEAKNIEIFIGK